MAEKVGFYIAQQDIKGRKGLSAKMVLVPILKIVGRQLGLNPFRRPAEADDTFPC